MNTVITICLIITAITAINFVVNGLGGVNFFEQIIEKKHSVGSDFLKIIIGVAAIITLYAGIKKVSAKFNT